MKASEVGFFKSYLLNQKGSILNKTLEFKNSTVRLVDGVTDEAETAALDSSMNMSIHLHERERSSLLQIERALSKIEEGTYGQCECCSEPIDVKRLKARPFATLCIDCMEDQEDPRRSLN